MSFTIDEAIERSNTINKDGILLDDYGNELRDENGEITIIPDLERKHFKVLKID